MASHRVQRIPLFKRPVGRLCALAGLFFLLWPLSGEAQRTRTDSSPARAGMERIDAAEGAARLANFRMQRLEGDYQFAFELEHKPRRERTRRYQGILWGTWNDEGARMRVRLFEAEAGSDSTNEVSRDWIIQNGPKPRAWVQLSPEGAFSPVEGEALFAPLLPGLTYTLFDLQMPFVYWPDAVYEGPVLVSGSRVAQTFLLTPPIDSPVRAQGITAVRIGLDNDYNALLRVEVIGEAEAVLSRFEVESFQKVSDQYIVKKITLSDRITRDRTSFLVQEAEVGRLLPPALFAIPEVGPVGPECEGERVE